MDFCQLARNSSYTYQDKQARFIYETEVSLKLFKVHKHCVGIYVMPMRSRLISSLLQIVMLVFLWEAVIRLWSQTPYVILHFLFLYFGFFVLKLVLKLKILFRVWEIAKT
jgi:hypothetical protein